MKLVNSAVEPEAEITEPVQQMNAAFATDGARLVLSGTIDTPVELVFIAIAKEIIEAVVAVEFIAFVVYAVEDVVTGQAVEHVGREVFVVSSGVFEQFANVARPLRTGRNQHLDRVAH